MSLSEIGVNTVESARPFSKENTLQWLSQYLEGPGFLCDDDVDGHEKQHDAESGERRGAQLLPQEVHGEGDGEGRRPDHVHVGGRVLEALRVHRHEVHDLPDRRALPSLVVQLQRLETKAAKCCRRNFATVEKSWSEKVLSLRGFQCVSARCSHTTGLSLVHFAWSLVCLNHPNDFDPQRSHYCVTQCALPSCRRRTSWPFSLSCPSRSSRGSSSE